MNVRSATVSEPPFGRICSDVEMRRGGRHRRGEAAYRAADRALALRLSTTAGLAAVTAGAVLGTSVAPPVLHLHDVRLAAVVGAALPAPLATALGDLGTQAALVIDGGLFGWDALVNAGADVVSGIGLGGASIGAGVNAAISAPILAAVAALAPVLGPVAAPLTATITSLASFIAAATTDAGAALDWKAQLDAVLADALAAGGVGLTNDLATALLGLFGITPTGLPTVDLSAAITALVNHVALGLDGAALGWDALVNLGADYVANLGLTGAAIVGGLNGAVSGTLLAALSALPPIAAPIEVPLTAAVTVASSLVGTLSTGAAAALGWKAQLDAVLADALAAGAVTAVNGVTGGLLGGIGTTPTGLPQADLSAAITALVNHIAAGIGLGVDVGGAMAGDINAGLPTATTPAAALRAAAPTPRAAAPSPEPAMNPVAGQPVSVLTSVVPVSSGYALPQTAAPQTARPRPPRSTTPAPLPRLSLTPNLATLNLALPGTAAAHSTTTAPDSPGASTGTPAAAGDKRGPNP